MESTFDPQVAELLQILKSRQRLSAEKLAKIGDFYRNLLAENEIQNLTRLTEPEKFYEGHFVDVVELLKTGWLDYPALDLGSGAGVPGLIAAILVDNAGDGTASSASADGVENQWIVVDSENRKAEYLAKAVSTLGLDGRVVAVHGRAEKYLADHSVGSVVVRAVGTVEKIYSWLVNCSTWNNLILFKGPKWEEEWAAFKLSKFRNRLKIVGTHEYLVGKDVQYTRKIIKLQIVPRGTSKRDE